MFVFFLLCNGIEDLGSGMYWHIILLLITILILTGSCPENAVVFYFSVAIVFPYVHFNLFSSWANISNSSSECDIITWSSVKRGVKFEGFWQWGCYNV
jgi:hypothetical protein